MSTSAHATEQWTPASVIDRELVLKELDAILASYHFRGSKRYPAMLRYVVSAVLDGRAGALKERTLGVEVFGRDPDYDTSADPVVRFSASEVRKRIAQYYHENGKSSRLQIELPLGSYVPEFLLRAEEEPDIFAGFDKERLPAPAPSTSGRGGLKIGLLLAATLLAGGVAGTYAYRKLTTRKPSVSDQFWGPIMKTPGQILIVLGTSHNGSKWIPETEQTTFLEHMAGPYHHVSVAVATALANVAGQLREDGRNYEIKEDTETSLTDLHARALILVGATNNAWTMRLLNQQRYSFKPGPLAMIQDAKNPGNTDWLIDFSQPYSSVAIDYGIVARFRDPTTEGPVMVVAGIGPYGTEAASAFVSTPQYLDQAASKLPAGWQDKNIEMVIKTEVIDGKAGPPVLVASTVW